MELLSYLLALINLNNVNAAQFPFSFMNTSGLTAPDGTLLITTGNTITIPSNTKKQWSSCQIDAGGTLQCVGTTDNKWCEFSCSGNLVNNGTIKYVVFDNSGASGTIIKTSDIDGTPLSWSFTQAAGGKADDQCGGCGSGLAGLYGNGSGSTGFDDVSCQPASQPVNNTVGGVGGIGQCSGYPNNSGGSGGSVFSGSGSSGTSSYCDFSDSGYGGGGGGGARGYSGGPLYIRIAGTMSGNGTFDVSGTAGGAGGQTGGNEYYKGGGGAGGSGGKLQIVVAGANSFSGTYSKSGGTGGDGNDDCSAGYGDGSNGSTGTCTINGSACP
jgi:hypothetical protein